MTIPHYYVAIAVIEQHGKFLIAKRPPGSYMPGLWEFPGGKCENGEAPEDALTREAFEELGIQIKASTSERFHTIEHDYKDRWVTLYCYLVKQFNGEPHGKEGQEICWVNLEELSLYEFPPANAEILEALHQQLG